MSLEGCKATSPGFSSMWPSDRINSQVMHLFSFDGNCADRTTRKLKVIVDGSVLKHGSDWLTRNACQTVKDRFVLSGSTSYDADADDLVIYFDKLIDVPATDIKSFGLTVPIYFQAANNNRVSAATAVAAAESQLLMWTATKNPICLERFFVLAQAACIYEFLQPAPDIQKAIAFQFDLDMVVISTTFKASPLIRPLPTVMTTALSKGLVESTASDFLHSQPKSGFVTSNENKRLLLLLDSDPKVAMLSLVGIWVSGVNDVHHPFVWAACARYAHARDMKSTSKTTFLLIVYDRITFSPNFYECVALHETAIDRGPACKELHAHVSGVLSECKTVVAYATPRKQKSIGQTGKHDSVATPCQRLSFAASPSTAGITLEPSRQARDPTSSSADVCDDSIPSPIPLEVRRLLAAQEKQLNDLRRRVDDLTRDKSNGFLREPSSSSSSSTSEGTTLTTPTPTVGKVVSSTATMTSFAFPPLTALRSPLSVSASPIEAESNAERSLEYPRDMLQQQQQQQEQCAHRKDDAGQSALSSFADLQLDSMITEPSAVEWRHPSWPLGDGLQDPDFESALLSCSQRLTPSCCQEDEPIVVGPNSDATFYDDLLRRIQTILLNQSTDVRTEGNGRSNVGRAPSGFDSMFLPRLNYVSLRLNDDDEASNDRSAQFEVLARKYLVGCRTVDNEPTDLSLDTLRYLKKFRLLR